MEISLENLYMDIGAQRVNSSGNSTCLLCDKVLTDFILLCFS